MNLLVLAFLALLLIGAVGIAYAIDPHRSRRDHDS